MVCGAAVGVRVCLVVACFLECVYVQVALAW